MLSIIIPTYNEAEQIAQTISKIHVANRNYDVEIIVVDGGSTDDTINTANKYGASVIHSKYKGRAAQMNMGALVAKHDILYFLHADSIPPHDFTSGIFEAFNKGAKSGCFRLQFDSDHWFLNANAWFTRFNLNAFRFGDQSLFVTKEIFQKASGFREDLLMMEDQEIVSRLKKFGKFEVIDDYVTTLARKYQYNGVYRMQSIFFLIWSLYYLGYSQEKLIEIRQKLIKNHKL
ncbi:TIGR04283 family arsenosugar biosynthesis glycosyltransferase [Gillisia sp. CAL575]|uniref:TIGR04283 family arsenosugar biosynthesis glycosyltransferase n=1 Tax=Gillisia sp. CAL575 TaxID=985255 RepID=UPI0003AA18B4|nr:TIGR04283 family arsenosugar biosynthesis glycosyltransferase [Gillisia sp. CAL575]